MFDIHKRRIAIKKYVWDRIRNGELMTLTIDLETSGIGRQKVPYATPASPFITEWGDCLTDLAGNYLNSAQIKPRRPENQAFEPAAAILQRVRDMGPELFDDEGRMPYWQAMAAMAWRAEQAAYAYEEMAKSFGEKPRAISLTDFNKAFRRGAIPGQVKATELVYDIPLREEDGSIVYDVRYHPDRRKVSYRFHKDAENWKSQEYLEEDNFFYRDEANGSLWKWVDAGVHYDGYNFNRYDLPILRSNLYRVGFNPVDTTMFYSRATPTAKQKKKPHLIDVRDTAYMVSLFGDQGEAGLKLGEMEDPATGRIRRSEALGAIHKANTGQPIPGRLLRGGPFDPRDGSYFDLKLAHGAVADAAATAALRNLCEDIAPDLCARLYRQSDQKKLYEVLTAQSPQGDKLPLFSLPRRDGGRSHSELPYWFLGTDDQIGRFKKLIFLKADGSLHKASYKNKLLKDLSVEEWEEYLDILQERRDPDRSVRVESVRRWPGAMPIDEVLKNSAQAERYKTRIEDIGLDCKYIAENQEMCERIIQAQAIRTHHMQYGKKLPHNEFIEDALPRKYSPEIAFQEEECELERRMIWQKSGGGAQKIEGVLQAINSGMNNDYRSYMRAIDESLDELCVKGLAIDWYKDMDLDNLIHLQDTPEGYQAKEVLHNFKTLVERVAKKFKRKNWPYLDEIRSIINPETGEPFIQGTKFNAFSVGQAYMFRQLLGERMLQDFETLFRLKDCPYLEGYTGTDFCTYTYGKRTLMLHADADNGKSGAAPHVVDENGQEVPLSIIKGLNHHIDFPAGTSQGVRDVLDNLLVSGQWRYRFYRDPTEPGITRLMERFVDLRMKDKLPPGIRQMYDAGYINRMAGMAHDDASTDRMPTLRTMEKECDRLMMAATSRDPRLLERDPNPDITAAAKALKTEEGLQILAYIRNFIARENEKLAQVKDPGYARRTDPETGLPLDFIPVTIRRDSATPMESDPNFILMDVPVWHMRHPVEQEDNRLPRQFLVVPAMKNDFRKAANKDRNAKPVLVRGLEDGRIVTTGRHSRIMTFDQNDPSLATIWEKVRHDYADAGIQLTDKSRLWLVAAEDIYPLAGTKTIDWRLPSLKVPSTHFDALVAPAYANMGDTPLSAVLMPLDYFPQQMKEGQRVRLRQMKADMFANIHGETDAADTGHTYETKITAIIGFNEVSGKIEGIPRKKFLRMVENHQISPSYLEAAGFAGGSVRHVQQVLDRLVTEKWKDRPDDMPLVLVAFEQVNGRYLKEGRQQKDNTYAYCHLTAPPKAALEVDGKPVTPTAYYEIK